MPETWSCHKAIALLLLLLSKKWRLGRETSYSKLQEPLLESTFPIFSSLPCQHPTHLRVRSLRSLEGAGRHVGSVRVALPGRPEEPPAPSCGLRNSGGPGEVWKTELRHQLSSERRLQERGEGPPAVPRPQHPCHPATPPQKALGPQLSSLRPAGRQGIEGGSSPRQPASDIPTPPKDAAAVPCPRSLNVTAPSSSRSG